MEFHLSRGLEERQYNLDGFRNRKVKKTVGFGSPVSDEIKILEQSNKNENFEDQLKLNDRFLKVRRFSV